MAILKIQKGEQFTLAGMLDYINDNQKHKNGVIYFNSVYASPNNPLRDMSIVKLLENQTEGTQYRQIVLSLPADESGVDNISDFIYISNLVGLELANYFGCQVAYAVHSNTDNLHAHFVLNSVRLKDGKKIQIRHPDTMTIKDSVNKILEAYGFQKAYYYKDNHFN